MDVRLALFRDALGSMQIAMDISNDQLERIWNQVDSGTKYPGWHADRKGALEVLTRLAPETSWTRVPPDAWKHAPTPAEVANA